MKAVFACGRFNPPTVGHRKMIERMSKVGKPVFIFATGSQDRLRNPLHLDQKLGFLRSMFPSVRIDTAINAFDAATKLRERGFETITFFCGEDRRDLGEALIAYGAADEITIVERTTEEASATQCRQEAARGDFDSFRNLIATRDIVLAKRVFDAVRASQGEE